MQGTSPPRPHFATEATRVEPVHNQVIARDYASDGDEAYDMPHLSRYNSNTPLAEQSGGSRGQSRDASPDHYAPPPPQPAAMGYDPRPPTTPYPPAPSSSFHSVPLNDTFSGSQLPPRSASAAAQYPPAGAATPPPGARARSKLGFVQLHNFGHQEDAPQSAATSTSTFEMNEKAPQAAVTGGGRPKHMRRQSSYDALNEWEEYNPATAKDPRLRFAEGDAGTTKFSRLYLWALNRGIVVRWTLFIVPFLAMLWIPGIVGVTAKPDAHIWGVKLLWWSIWLTVVWLGFWGSKAAFMIFPGVYRNTICVVVPSMKKYTDIVRNLGRYAKLVIWSLVIWIAWQPLISRRYDGSDDSPSRSNLDLIGKLLFGLLLCMIVWGVEKLLVQLIALQFHRDSYAERLQEQKWNFKMLTKLYINSHDIPGRSDTLDDRSSAKTSRTRLGVRKVIRGVKAAAQSTTTALGNVASEMAGSSVLQTNSPANKVTAALSSANKSRALGRRLFYSFRRPGAASVTLADIARFFPSLEEAEHAFSIFDRDGNGDATRDEIDAAMLEMHRERMALEASMRDLDGAVRRLDDILLIIVLAICVLIMSAMITQKVSAFITGAGSFILSISWMIGTTMQEVLLACIFLFVKHPYDVGDRVDIDGNSYTVAKMELMSTSFKRVDGKFVWIGHNVLALKVIENVRRSGPTSETFTFEVAFNTTFEKLQALRAKMLKFCTDNSRDFQPAFDVIVDDIPAQGKMILKADIRYKSNWQQGALKVQRRNKWVCHLKMCLSDLQIWGPDDAGDPDPPPAETIKYTQVPYEDVLESEHAAARAAYEQNHERSPPPSFSAATGANLFSRRHDSSLDLFGEHLDESLAPSRAASPGPDQALRVGGLPTQPPRSASGTVPTLATPLPPAPQAVQQLHGQEGSFRPNPPAGGYQPPRI